MSDAPAPAKPESPRTLTETPSQTVRRTYLGLETDVTFGRLPIFDAKQEIEALIFYTAYIKVSEAPAQERPIMFVFNGGPGSPSVWLHMGALGPMRAPMLADGNLPPMPYAALENPESWLDRFDLVFVDPAGTGWSEVRDEKAGEKHWSLNGDIEAMGDFIRLFLARHNRTGSPLYLCGESYGTTRCAGLADNLTSRGASLAGVVLISMVLNFQTLEFRVGNDLPYALFLPTYAAIGRHHGRVRRRSLDSLLKEARTFALGEYWSALAQGSRLGAAAKRRVAEKMASLTGLSAEFILRNDLRVEIMAFCRELLRSEGRSVGRLDGRIRGFEPEGKGTAERPEFDPSLNMLMGPYVAVYKEHMAGLGWQTDLPYRIFDGITKPWEFGRARDGYPDTSQALRRALARNPYTKVLLCSGLYDLATPFAAAEYTLSHMHLPAELAGNITIREYPAGHMMYIEEGSLSSLKADVVAWANEG